MIDKIIQFHNELEKGQCVKLITTRKGYDTYIFRGDELLKEKNNIMLINRNNGGKIAINTDLVVSCSLIKKF